MGPPGVPAISNVSVIKCTTSVSLKRPETVICSTKRLTYVEAQQIIDGKTGGHAREVVTLVQAAGELARRIEAQRFEAGMLHLELPEVDLTFDAAGDVPGFYSVNRVGADGKYEMEFLR